MKALMVAVALMVGTPVFANEMMEKVGPCKKVIGACLAAGFKKGDHKDKKGLFIDCVEPILKGEAVAGVSADAADVAACNEKKAEKGKKK